MIRRTMVAVVLAAMLAACGGESEPGDGAGGTGTVEGPVCAAPVTPCGGDPVGVWTFEEVCGAIERRLPITDAFPECDDLPAVTTYDKYEGRLDFRADGTVEGITSVAYTTRMEVPTACLRKLGSGSLPGICVTVGRAVAGDAPGACTWETDDRCHCAFVIEDDSPYTREWAAEGGTLTVENKSFDFCVADGFLVRSDGAITQVLSQGTDGGGGSGGSGPGEAPVCDEGFTACGGDPTGVWKYDQTCDSFSGSIDLSDTGTACQDLPITTESNVEGQVYFRADGELHDIIELEEINRFDVPVACLSELFAAAAPEACAALGDRMKDQGGYLGGCYWQAGEVCHCELAIDVDNAGSITTWTADGGTLDEAGIGSFEFCVQGDYLVRRRATEAGQMVHVLSRIF